MDTDGWQSSNLWQSTFSFIKQWRKPLEFRPRVYLSMSVYLKKWIICFICLFLFELESNWNVLCFWLKSPSRIYSFTVKSNLSGGSHLAVSGTVETFKLSVFYSHRSCTIIPIIHPHSPNLCPLVGPPWGPATRCCCTQPLCMWRMLQWLASQRRQSITCNFKCAELFKNTQVWHLFWRCMEFISRVKVWDRKSFNILLSLLWWLKFFVVSFKIPLNPRIFLKGWSQWQLGQWGFLWLHNHVWPAFL